MAVVSAELATTFDTLTQFVLCAGPASALGRVYNADYSLPLELMHRRDRHGRHQPVTAGTLYGRMAFEDPLVAAVYGTENVLYGQGRAASTADVVLASDPSGDLLGS